MSVADTAKNLDALGVNKRIAAAKLLAENALASAASMVVKPTRVLAVATNGNDTTGDGSFAKPYATVQKAIDVALSATQIVIMSGTYTQSPTCSKANLTFTSLGLEPGGLVNINGTFTFSHTISSVRCTGLTIQTVNHTGAGSLYLHTCKTEVALNNSSGGYLEVLDSDTQGVGTGTITITGGGTKVFSASCKMGVLTVNSATALVNVHNPLASFPILLQSGLLLLGKGVYYSSGETSPALTATGGLVILDGPDFVTPNRQTARISIGAAAQFQILRASLDVANSTFAGTRVPAPTLLDESISVRDLDPSVTIYDDWNRTTANAVGQVLLQNSATWTNHDGKLRKFKSFRFYAAYTDINSVSHMLVSEVSKQSLLSLPANTRFALGMGNNLFLSLSIQSPNAFTIEEITGNSEPRLLRVEGVY